METGPKGRSRGRGRVEDAPRVPTPIVFIHIPKSAGTTFARYLQQNCGAPEKAMLAFYGDYKIYEGLTDVPLVAAHAAFWKMSKLFPKGRFVTWLRHPVDRAISQYKSWNNPRNLHPHWVKNLPERSFEHIYFAQKATLEEFVFSDHPEVIKNLQNLYAGYLSSEPFQGHRWLESAKENLVRRFEFFGLVERFDDSMRIFKHAFGWEAEFREEKDYANRSRQQGVVPSVRAVERIMELNQLDMELYQFAKLLFEDRLRRVNVVQENRPVAPVEAVAEAAGEEPMVAEAAADGPAGDGPVPAETAAAEAVAVDPATAAGVAA